MRCSHHPSPSLFVYCRDALGLSEWEAYNRIEVARAARSASSHQYAARYCAPSSFTAEAIRAKVQKA